MKNSVSVCLILIFMTQTGHAGESPARVTASDLVQADLVTDASDFSAPFMVGVRFRIHEGWNLYWKNPGDAGLPIEVVWELPDGFSAGPLQLPTPAKIVHDDVIAYGYTDEVVLLTRITPHPGYAAGERATIGAKLDYLVCRDRCLAGNATVALTLDEESARSRPEHRQLFERFTSRLPRPANGIDISIGKPEVIDRSLITIPVRGVAVTDFYPETIPDFVIEHNTVRIEGGAIHMQVTPFDESASLKEIRGLLIAGGHGYEVLVPVAADAGASR